MTFAKRASQRATPLDSVHSSQIARRRFLAAAAAFSLEACGGSDSGLGQRPGLVGGAPVPVGPVNSFQATNKFQSYTVPADGWYLLDVRGAQGGAASNASHQGGKGARMQGYANLRKGDVLRIAVGSAGGVGVGDGNNPSGGGGGGGSSIVLIASGGSVDTPTSSDTNLLFAGGGGGAGSNYNGSSGLISESGGPPNEGTNGRGAGVGNSPRGGAGGAGYLTDGGTHYDGAGALLSQGGFSYLKGGNNGGTVDVVPGQFYGGFGGWGGGGQGSRASSGKDGAGGGGGGYSGGGGGANPGDGAGGGGSYVSPILNTTLAVSSWGYQSGDGAVEITPVSGEPVF